MLCITSMFPNLLDLSLTNHDYDDNDDDDIVFA